MLAIFLQFFVTFQAMLAVCKNFIGNFIFLILKYRFSLRCWFFKFSFMFSEASKQLPGDFQKPHKIRSSIDFCKLSLPLLFSHRDRSPPIRGFCSYSRDSYVTRCSSLEKKLTVMAFGENEVPSSWLPEAGS